MRKFADKEQAIKQVNGSNTEATLILCGYSGERANTVLYCTVLFCTVLYKKRRMKEEKIRKFADTQSDKEQSSSSKTEATLILCGYSGERANNRGDSTIKQEDEEMKN